MKNKMPLILLVALVVGVGAYALVNKPTSPVDTLVKTAEDGEKIADEKMEDQQMTEESLGRYVIHDETAVADAADTRRVLFFYANWCPTCRPVDAELRANEADIPEDVTVIRVNYNDNEVDDAEEALAQKYGVTYQHTFVQIDAAGNEVAKWNGGNMDDLLENLR